MEIEHQLPDEEDAFSDGRPTYRQIEIAEWLSGYKGTAVPQECYDDRQAWWRWINSLITRLDIDIANEMRLDFGLRCDFRDPVSVIGCLKFHEKVRSGEISRSKLQRQRVKELLVNGADPYSIADQFQMSDEVVFEIVREVEGEGYLVEGI